MTVTTHKGGQRVNVGVLPLRDARILERCVVSGLIYPPPSRQVSAAAVLASRGCPFSCTYCASPAFYGCHIDKRPPREVAAEVVDLSRRFGTNMVYFTDLTFNLDPSYTEAICDSLMAARSRVKWYALFRPSGVDRALAQKLRLAGCSRVSVGIEFTEVDLLACTHRGGPDYMRTVKTCLENLDEAGIITRGLVMVGHPRETETMRDALLRQLTSLPLDDLRVGVLTPFPGSVFYDQMVRERRLLTRDFRLFDARHAVTGLNEADARQTEQAAQRLFHAFHSDPDHNERLDRKAVTNREFAEALAEYRAASRTSGVRRRTGEKKGVS